MNDPRVLAAVLGTWVAILALTVPRPAAAAPAGGPPNDDTAPAAPTEEVPSPTPGAPQEPTSPSDDTPPPGPLADETPPSPSNPASPSDGAPPPGPLADETPPNDLTPPEPLADEPSPNDVTRPSAAGPAPAAPTAASEVGKAAPQQKWASLHVFARLNTVVGGRRLGRYRFESLLVVPGATGQLTPWFSWTFNAVAYAERFDAAHLRVLDTVGMFKVVDQFQIWVGRFVVPFDRFNLSGPFRNLIWNYPGFYDGVRRIGGENGPFGRDTGAAIWGTIKQGLFKYQVMAHQLELGGAPRLSGRVSFSALDREPGYFLAGTYLGSRNVITLGAAAQYQHNGRTMTPPPATEPMAMAPSADPVVLGDLWAVTADLFVEKTLGRAGAGTVDGAFYQYDEHRAYRRAYMASLAYLLPWQIGPGRGQLGVRWQHAYANDRMPLLFDLMAVDASASYFIPTFDLRLGIDYARQWLGNGVTYDAISIGLQFSHS